MDHQGRPWTPQFTGEEIKAQRQEDACPVTAQVRDRCSQLALGGGVGKAGLQPSGSAGAYRAGGPGCSHPSGSSASWSPCSSQGSR